MFQSAVNELKKKNNDPLIKDAIEEIAFQDNSSFFMKHTISELLFDGYDDLLTEVSEHFFPEIPKMRKFAWFVSKNNTSSEGVIKIFSGEHDLDKMGLIYSWNGKRKLQHWHGVCNEFGKSTMADIFPPFITPKPKTVQIFVPDMCRYVLMISSFYLSANVVFSNNSSV